MRRSFLNGERVQWQPQGVVGAYERLGYVGGVDQVLPCGSPDQVVGAFRVNAVLVAGQGPLAQLAHLGSLVGSPFRGCEAVRIQAQPRCYACHQAAEGLHVHHLAVAVVKRGRELGLHVLLQLAFGHVLQHGLRHFPGLLAPVFAVRQRCSLFLCTDNRNGTEEEKKGE